MQICTVSYISCITVHDLAKFITRKSNSDLCHGEIKK